MNNPKIKYFYSRRSGQPVHNQVAVEVDNFKYFYSYGKLICKLTDDGPFSTIEIDKGWYEQRTQTTLKYLRDFLGREFPHDLMVVILRSPKINFTKLN